MSSFANLRDSFNDLTGIPLANYIASDGTPRSTQRHYDLRSYFNDSPTVPWTMNDMSFYNIDYFSNLTMDSFTHRRSVSNAIFRRHTMSEVDAYTMTQIDALTMDNLDFSVVSAGNEEWPTGDGDVTFGKDSTYLYANSLRVNLVTASTKTVTSHFNDDILTGFQDTDYFIEIALPGFPSQAAGAKLNLANSFIDFSSDINFAGGQTDSVAFNESLNDLSAGGNTYFRINRTRLVNLAQGNLQAIRFRLIALGGSFTLTIMAMRLLPTNYIFNPIEIDTKKGVLTRTIPRTGTPAIAVTTDSRFFRNIRPKNGEYYVRFNSGHNPVGNSNVFRFYLRQQTSGDHTRVELWCDSTQSRLRIYENVGGVDTEIFSTTAGTNILTEETSYWLYITISEQTINAAIYNYDGVYLTSLVYQTGNKTLSRSARGYVGYSFEPYNYDVRIDSIIAQSKEFAYFESTVFNSITPVVGATLQSTTSKESNLIDGVSFTSYGDATVTNDSTTTEYTVTRTGVQWSGGMISAVDLNLGSTDSMSIEGDIYIDLANAEYRVALVDNNTSVGWIQNIPNLSANQWNHFKLVMNLKDIPPQSFFLHLQQTGFLTDSFRFKNLKLNYAGIKWFASADAGTTWQPFLDAQDTYYSGIRFSVVGTALKVRAIARTDDAWIQGYTIIPRYLT